jgi:hypothetical protein
MPQRGLIALLGTLLALAAHESRGVGRITLEAAQVAVAGVSSSGARVELELSGEQLSLRAQAARLQLQQAAIAPSLRSYSDLQLRCARVDVSQPLLACREGSFTARGGPAGSVSLRLEAAYDTALQALLISGSGLAVAGGQARFEANAGTRSWSVHADASAIELPAARQLAAPWVHVPEDYSADGHVNAHIEASGGASRPVRARIEARTTDLHFTNQAGTLVAEKIAASVSGTLLRKSGGFDIDAQMASTGGQTLLTAVLLDFGVNPLELHMHGALLGGELDLTEVSLAQRGLIEAQGTVAARLGEQPALKHAQVQISRISFPAAYRSYLQLALATTDFGALQTSGNASGSLEIVDDTLRRIDLRLTDLDISDPNNRLAMADMSGDIHWSADSASPVEASQLSWTRSIVYGLQGGAAQLRFNASGRSFALLGATRLPIFDGALMVHTLAARGIGSAAAEMDFDAQIEPISMPLLSKAFGWPQLSGMLAGRIPGVTYREGVLSVQGDVVARVFDGTIVGSGLRLQDPLGPWPRLFADVTARGLDLELVTRTFPIGSITGRLDVELRGLELFNWSPVAFDARLYSSPSDSSQHRISQKAITSISSVGGGGGGVTAALQSSLLRFFDTFGYDRIGISCQLRNDVCLMAGIEPARQGYYLVKGRGLPRIDIIGNSGRVDWRQLVSQVTAGVHSQNIVVK